MSAILFQKKKKHLKFITCLNVFMGFIFSCLEEERMACSLEFRQSE